MRTISLTCVVKDGDYKVAQYGLLDGYPLGQGITILTFLREKLNRNVFLANLAHTYRPNLEEYKVLQEELAADGRELSVVFPGLSHKTGGNILEGIQAATKSVPVFKNLELAANSCCEWAYVVDLDNNNFEVFRGFSKIPLTTDDRFFDVYSKDNNGYEPVRHVKTYQLDALPSDEQFLADLEPLAEKT